MKYHLDCALRLQTEPEHKSLYSWAIVEIDADGRSLNRDQIPWTWTCIFSAQSCVVTDRFEIVHPFSLFDNNAGQQPRFETDQLIRLKLRPGYRQEGKWSDVTSFSMFGTKRPIQNILLEIRPTDERSKDEACSAWGSVSHTIEIDFRDETSNDCLWFFLHIKPASFARYAALIQLARIDEIVFSVGPVEGFYSDWSPSIFTDNVKVLLSENEHKVDRPLEFQTPLPRLGKVHGAKLLLNRRLDLDD